MDIINAINKIKCLIKSWKALWLYAFGNENKAIIEFENCLKIDPTNGQNLRTLGIILINKERFQEGIVKIEEAIRYLSPDDKSMPEVLAYNAYANFKLDKLDKSVNLYKRAISIWRKDGVFKKTDLIYTLGRIYLQQELYGNAKDVFLEGLKLNEMEENIHFGLGISYFEIGQNEKSMHHIEKAVEINPLLKENETLKKIEHKLKQNITFH